MTETPDAVIPVEIITITVQRSTRYVRTNNARTAIAAIEKHIACRPDRYDDDEVIAQTHTVQLKADATPLGDAYALTPDELTEDSI